MILIAEDFQLEKKSKQLCHDIRKYHYYFPSHIWDLKRKVILKKHYSTTAITWIASKIHFRHCCDKQLNEVGLTAASPNWACFLFFICFKFLTLKTFIELSFINAQWRVKAISDQTVFKITEILFYKINSIAFLLVDR